MTDAQDLPPVFVGNGLCDRCGTVHSPGYDLCPKPRVEAQDPAPVLSPCPSCGGNGCWYQLTDNVYCTGCTLSAHKDDWNRRSPLPERDAVLEEAAKVAETRHTMWRMPHPDDAEPGEVCCDVSACEDIARTLLALQEPKP